MPQVHKLDPGLDNRNSGPLNELPELPHPDLSAFIASIRARRSVIVATTGAAVLIALLYVFTATPQFSSSASILIDTKSNSRLRNVQTVPDANVDSANLESQVEVLRSERIVRQVVLDQHLIDDPALAPGWLSAAIFSVMNKVAFWKTARPPDPLDDPKLTAAAQALGRLLDARRVGNTYIVQLTATMPNPVQAARVVNSYARTYIDDQQRLREDLSRRQSQMLQDRSTELQLKVRQAEQAVEEMKFAGSLQDVNSAKASVILKDLESSAQNYRTLHDKFLEQATETWQQQYLSIPDAQIASPGYAPLSKSSPKTLIVLSSAIVFGLAAGVVVIILLDRRKIGLSVS